MQSRQWPVSDFALSGSSLRVLVAVMAPPSAPERLPAASCWAAAGLSPLREPGHGRRSPQQAGPARGRGCGQGAPCVLRVSLSCRPPRLLTSMGQGNYSKMSVYFLERLTGLVRGSVLKLDNEQYPGFSSDLSSVHVEVSGPRSTDVPPRASHHTRVSPSALPFPRCQWGWGVGSLWVR